MNREPTTVEKLRGLPWSIASNATNAVFVQLTFFGSVFVLFLNALGLQKTQMGLLLSLLPFAGIIAPFIAPAVSRLGYKRAYILSFGTRNLPAAALILTPWIMGHYGQATTLLFVGGMMGLFSLMRAVGMTATYPWVQEYVPSAVQGKFTATSNAFTTVMGFLAIVLATYVLARAPGISGFTLLIAIGVVFGLISVALTTRIPGGVPASGTDRNPRRNLGEALHDRDFLRFLGGVGLYTLAITPLASFVPLFMREQIGLSASNVVLLQLGIMLGGLMTSYLWGWAADRYGSRPVTLSTVGVRILLPVLWLLMPREAAWRLYPALAIAFFQGMLDMGWGVSSSRLLYVNVVPAKKKMDYMALYYAWIGLVGGFSQLIGGRLIDLSRGISGRFLFVTLDPYLPLFLIGLLLPIASVALFSHVRADSVVNMRQFAGFFLRGNPLLAMGSVIRYHLAKDEEEAIQMTERLTHAGSLLTVDELLESLADPRFNVRFEAVIAIAHMAPDPRLVDALGTVLQGEEPALSTVAAWALGRLGDPAAAEPLRKALNSSYRSVAGHGARALASLGDSTIVPLIQRRLAQEEDPTLQVAYAAALGRLGTAEAIPQLLVLLRNCVDEYSRMEVALALARIVGNEHRFVQLMRQLRSDPGTASAQVAEGLARHLKKIRPGEVDLQGRTFDSANAFAVDDFDRGIEALVSVLREMPWETWGSDCGMVLQETSQRSSEFGKERIEYLLLTLHLLGESWQAGG